MPFIKATPDNAKIHLALIGPTGAGKTFTALEIARGLAGPSGRIAMLDSERSRGKVYSARFEFDHMSLATTSPNAYIAAIHEAEEAGYSVLIVDSLTHAWSGQEGALALVDAAAKKAAGNKFVAWADVTPLHNRLLEAITSDKMHVICTLRAKMEYTLEPGPSGKMQPRKIGLGPVQRDGIEYEFDVTAMMDETHNLVITKTVFEQLDGKVIPLPDTKFGASLLRFLVEKKTTAPATQKQESAAPAQAAPTTSRSAPPPVTAAPTNGTAKPWAKWQMIQLAKLSEMLGQSGDERHAFILSAIKATEGETWETVKPRLTTEQAGIALDAMRAAIAARTATK